MWRRRVPAAAVVATVLVAAEVALAGCGAGRSPAREAGRPATSFDCPPAHAHVHPAPGDTLPRGARAARICYSADMPVAWLAPYDALTRGVGRLVGVVNRQGDYPPTDVCTDDAGPAFRILFEYADGARLVSGETAGCREMRVGVTERVGGRKVWNTYFRLLARQREHASPGPLPEASAPSCDAAGLRLPFSPLWDGSGLARARLCVLASDGPGVDLTAHEVAVLRHDLLTSGARRRRQPSPERFCDASTRAGYDVVAVDAWGDHIDIRGQCELYVAHLPGASSGYVRELPTTRRMIARLAAAARR